MIAKTFTALYTRLDDYLRRAFHLNEEIVSLQPPVKGGQASVPDNRLHLFLAHIERETAGGMAFNRQKSTGGSHFRSSLPEWQLNVYAMLAAVFG
ncbi:MAG: Pvc16 family protein, partial [Prevotellaceae bacterium]|nr:Pvc16 family protein [Prevotellaceae bacterium]